MQRNNYKKLLHLLEEYLKLGCNIKYFHSSTFLDNKFALTGPGDGTWITEGNTMEELLINIGKLK